MIFNFITARRRAAAMKIEAIDFDRGEVFHPVIADLMLAQEKAISLSSHERDYGAKRGPVLMPVAFL
jgi:hypothetical protein